MKEEDRPHRSTTMVAGAEDYSSSCTPAMAANVVSPPRKPKVTPFATTQH